MKDELIEPAVCQWEHILSREVANSICTLLGHPRQSPRHLPIPAGEFTMGSPLTDPGRSAAEGPETRVPWVGEHTTELLGAELGLSAAELAGLRERGVIS